MTTPTKPTADNLPRVSRGGGWHSNRAVWVRAASRFGVAPSYRDNDVGFRCAQRGSRQPLGKAEP